MKLLIVTQVIDKNHTILGFFHRWVEEFAKNYEQVEVICLEKGGYSLPENVHVHSLGKEEEKGRLTYLIRFYSLMWKLRNDYDSVFVHMNQIYVILGAPFWRLLKKKVGFWYAHGTVSFSLKLAEKLTNKIFTSTLEGFRIKSRKIEIVGQGIDINRFFPPDLKAKSESVRLITVGRLSPSKNIGTLIEACALLRQRGMFLNFKIIGKSITEAEKKHEDDLKKMVKYKKLEKEIEWVGGVSNHELSKYLQESDVFIHDGATNSLDKALLEAVLCGCVVLSSNPAYKSLVQNYNLLTTYSVNDSKALANLIMMSKNGEFFEKSKLIQDFVKRNHSVNNLIAGIVSKY